MTLIRRNARATQRCPISSNNDKWENYIPSKETQIKAESTKQYLEDHFGKIFDDTKEREDRFGQFTRTLNSPDLDDSEREKLKSQYAKDEADYSRLSRVPLKPSQYERIKLIGRGGFGEVWLVQDKLSKNFYALKVLRKADIIFYEQIENVRNERNILARADNPWFTALQCSFQDEEFLYLVLEYVPGGDLMTALIKKGIFTNEETKFYTAEIALAVHAVHELHFLHRDLKPDNILLTEYGHIKLTDFGLSKHYSEKPDTRFQKLNDDIMEVLTGKPATPHHLRGTQIGTYSYTAPEVLRGKPPTTLSDYWSLGVIMYEMLYGYLPFRGQSQQETYFRINAWKRALVFPQTDPPVSPAAIDLMKHLLCEPEDRYDFEEIKSHPFFEGFDFEDPTENMPPLVPIIRSPTDTSNFDEFDPSESSLASKVPLANIAKYAFLGYTYKPKPHSPSFTRVFSND